VVGKASAWLRTVVRHGGSDIDETNDRSDRAGLDAELRIGGPTGPFTAQSSITHDGINDGIIVTDDEGIGTISTANRSLNHNP
jgi:hypothetical protein